MGRKTIIHVFILFTRQKKIQTGQKQWILRLKKEEQTQISEFDPYTAELNLPQCFHVLQSATKNVIEDAASRVENHILNVLNKKNKNNTS